MGSGHHPFHPLPFGRLSPGIRGRAMPSILASIGDWVGVVGGVCFGRWPKLKTTCPHVRARIRYQPFVMFLSSLPFVSYFFRGHFCATATRVDYIPYVFVQRELVWVKHGHLASGQHRLNIGAPPPAILGNRRG